jgi:hypothetical protein
LAHRQMLHAQTIVFHHPQTGVPLSFEATLWPDMQDMLQVLRSTSLCSR